MITHREDLPRSKLPTLENIVLWSMRAWVIGHCRRIDIASRIETVFVQLGVPESAAHLDGFMGALGGGVRRTLKVNCVCCKQVSADEAALLQVFAFQQDEAHEEAYAILEDMVTEAAAAACSDQAHRLALSLQAAGHLLIGATAINLHADSISPDDLLGNPFPRYLH